jgi:hypothetical protein
LRELLLTIEAPIHEGLIPPSGSLIVPNGTTVSGILPIESMHIDLARHAAGLGRIAEKRLGEDVWTSGYDMVCPKCGKTSQVEVLTITGWREREGGRSLPCL